MLQAIADYRDGKISYSEMAGDLEGTLDAGEFTDMNLRREWYDLWTPLEISRATKGDDTKHFEVEEYVSKIDNFLQEVL
jgi:hypothetical protein